MTSCRRFTHNSETLAPVLSRDWSFQCYDLISSLAGVLRHFPFIPEPRNVILRPQPFEMELGYQRAIS